MPVIHIIVLALIQGLTEFLPVSSSAHLILGGQVMGWEDQGLVFDVATHLGTLFAVLVYFRRDLQAMLMSCIGQQQDEVSRQHRSMMLFLGLASIPALFIGLAAHDLVEHYLRDVRVIAVTTIVFGLVLWWADLRGARSRELPDMNLRSAIWIGFAQVLALVPGVSRSGITITAGRFLGFTPDAAARFSFLLAIPIIGGVGVYGMYRVARGEDMMHWAQFGMAVVFAAIAGWVCIAAFLALLRRVGLLPFIIYRLALGAVLLWILY
jgi:undecaprenyl-diphosphatase